MLKWSVAVITDVIFVGDVCDLFLQFFYWSAIFSGGLVTVMLGMGQSPHPL